MHEAVAATGGLETFLQTRAPKWHQVGRVCFHLAENKNDDTRPFAFMATYTAGFGAAGRLQHLPLRKALEQYAGAQNRPALIKLLSPVQQAAERCEWVQKLVDSGAIYQPMAWSAGRAYEFLRSVPALEESGVSVRLPDWWKKRPRPQVSVRIGTQTPSMFGVDAMLDFDVQMALGDEALSEEELEALLASEDPLVLLKGQWVEVDRDKLQEAIAHWEALRQQARDGQISFRRGYAAAGRGLGGPAARGAGGRGAALGACRGRRGDARDTGAATPAGNLGRGRCQRGTAGHAATVSAAGRGLVAFCDATGPRRLPG